MKDKKTFWLWNCAGIIWLIGSVMQIISGNIEMIAMFMSVGAMNLAVARQYA